MIQSFHQFHQCHQLDHSALFSSYDAIQVEKTRQSVAKNTPRNALQAYLHTASQAKTGSGFQRMQRCRYFRVSVEIYFFIFFILILPFPAREALEALDRQGWQRSFHQRLFHDHFIRACARIFWKTEAPGAFARDHQKILEMNGWDHLSQEILVSTPRRSVFLRLLCTRGNIAFLAEALEEFFLCLWDDCTAAIAFPPA